ncbi:hypothetical protein ACWA2C_28030 [Priestia megaterium]
MAPIKFYFVYNGNLQEREAIQKCRPPNLMINYIYFKNKTIKEINESLGYKPNFMVDSGAFTQNNRGEPPDIFGYIKWLENNLEEMEYYISPDVMHDGRRTYENFVFMKEQGFNPVPVFHYKTETEWLDKYNDMGETFVALGSTVPERKKSLVRMWVNELAVQYINMNFHVLGTSSREIIDFCDLQSCDSSGWIKTANLRGSTRAERDKLAVQFMRKTMAFTC